MIWSTTIKTTTAAAAAIIINYGGVSNGSNIMLYCIDTERGNHHFIFLPRI